jgi:hypothetical protein
VELPTQCFEPLLTSYDLLLELVELVRSRGRWRRLLVLARVLRRVAV